MSDLIERLRVVSPADTWCGPTGLFTEAADEIERLEAENKMLVELVQEAYEMDSASFKDWLDMNGYRLANSEVET